MNCPACSSDRTRRGGTTIWLITLALIGAAVTAVLHFELHAGLVAGVVIAAVALAHILIGQRTCLDCGHQWRG